MFFVAKPNLLHFLVRTLEAADTFVVHPDSHTGFHSLLNCHQPVLVRVHAHNIISVSLEKLLLSSIYVLAYQYAACTVVYFIVLEN